MLRISPEAKLILANAKKILFNEQKDVVSSIKVDNINWQLFKDLIIYHELYSFAYPVIKELKDVIPLGLMDFFKSNYYYSLIRSQYLWQEFLKISDAFQKRKITMVPIKGVSLLADIYIDMPLRLMVDIDILIPEKEIEEAKKIFFNLGYNLDLGGLKEEYWLKKQCHITFSKKENKELSLVDVHFGLDFKRKNRNILPRLWQRLSVVNIDERRINLLSPEDQFFSLALHQRRFGKTLCLKGIFDIVLLLKKYLDFNWDYVLEECKRAGMCSTVYFTLAEAMLFLDADIPSDFLKKISIPGWKRKRIKRFIETNTFSPFKKQSKDLYLASHFLLYDSLWEPIDYILNIPHEQFARFYGLQTYDKRTESLYRNRIFYILYKTISGIILKENLRRYI